MALYRPVQVSYWEDADIMDFTADETYFYIYLLTNPNTKACGIYELSKQEMAYRTKKDLRWVNDMLNSLIEQGKIKYDETTREVFILNWIKYNQPNNRNLKKCIFFELERVKTEEFRDAYYTQLDEMGLNLDFEN